MALQITNAAGSDAQKTAQQVHAAIAEALPDAQVRVTPTSSGHFEIRVSSPSFEGKSRLAQQQLVYGAITSLMTGDRPPVHAVDRLDCVVPDSSP